MREPTAIHSDARKTSTYTVYPSALLLALFVSTGCASREAAPPATAPPPPPPPPSEHVPPPEPKRETKDAAQLGIRILSDVGFATPESVYYDAERDVYFVSNINGAPLDVDGNGFISRVSADGEIDRLFIDGARDGVTLNAPKGLTVVDGTLYVADIDRVSRFDVQTGAPQGEHVFPGASFINGVTAAPDGSVYVSDTGVDKTFSPTGKDAVYKIKQGKVQKILADKTLGGPNGLLFEADPKGKPGVWVVTFGSGELYWLGDTGKIEQRQKLLRGGNDGILRTNGGRLLISSWEGSSVLAGEAGRDFVELVSGVESPADIGYDTKRNRLLIPLFNKDSVVFQDLDDSGAPATPSASP